jgi:hypothetical protein
MEDTKECKDLLQRKEDLSSNDMVNLVDIRWFDLDDLTSAPTEFTIAQKNHLRRALAILHSAG